MSSQDKGDSMITLKINNDKISWECELAVARPGRSGHRALVDTGASYNFISEGKAKRTRKKTSLAIPSGVQIARIRDIEVKRIPLMHNKVSLRRRFRFLDKRMWDLD
nr:hypothetical protein [Tanacetum cinerariifolium]